MSSAIGMDYLYFGKLRVLLMMHEMSRYTLAVPAQEDAQDDPRIVESVGNMIRKIVFRIVSLLLGVTTKTFCLLLETI